MEVDIGQDVGSICSAIASNYYDTNAVIICGQSRAAQPTKPMAKHVPKAPAKTAHKSQPKAKGRAVKPKRAPMAPAPKQLPKPNPSNYLQPK